MGKALTIPTQVLALPVPSNAQTPTLQAGVHITWNMPDGLARGVADPDTTRGLDLPELPDRWLVLRVNPPGTGGKRTTRGWLIDSWRGTNTPLPGTVNTPSGAVTGQKLTILGLMDTSGNLINPPDPMVGPGPEAFAMYYPVARGRFGLYDPLGDVSTGPLSYVVVGWYSVASRDPLGGAASEWARLQFMTRARWKVPDVTFAAASMVDTTVTSLPQTPNTGSDSFNKRFSNTQAKSANGVGLKTFEPVPDHVVVHGMVSAVPVGGVGGIFANMNPNTPVASRVDFTVGDSYGDALGSLLSDQADIRWLLQVLQGSGLRSLQNLDALASVQADLHRQGFSQSDLPTPAGGTRSNPADPFRGGQYWRPSAPLLMATNAGRGFRYGHDGRYEADGKVRCRITGQRTVSLKIAATWIENNATQNLNVEIPAKNIGVLPPELAQLDPSVTELVEEALLLDPVSARFAATGLSPGAGNKAVSIWMRESTYWWNQALRTCDPSEVRNKSTYVGTLPSPLALTPWSDPWVTEYVEYQASFVPSAGALTTSWPLGEVDRAAAPTLSLMSAAVRVSGLAQANDGAPTVMAGMLDQFLLTPGLEAELGASNYSALQQKVHELRQLNILSFDLAGVDHALRNSGHSVRAGLLSFTSLKLVDLFGRTVALDLNRLRAIPGSVLSVGGVRGISMPPRAVRRARVDFRLLSAVNDAVAANDTNSPLCGFLAVDYVDGALEVFDANGEGLGQLRREGGVVVFEPTPGKETLSSQRGMSNAANVHLRRVVQGLLDASRVPTPGTPDALSALLALMDSVRHTIDRRGNADEHLALLLGNPIAVVRARAALHLEAEAATTPAAAPGGTKGGGGIDMSSTVPTSPSGTVSNNPGPTAPASPYGPPFTLTTRLGNLAHLDDGLLGYVLDVDPGKIQTPLGPNTHLTDDIFGVDHNLNQLPTIVPGAELSLSSNGDVVPLTLLMTPGSNVYCTSGMFPVSQVNLTKEWLDKGLQKMVPTFSFGPLLVEPSSLRLPIPGSERFEWSWVHRTKPAGGTEGWGDDVLSPANDRALFPNGAVLVQEGWLKGKRVETP